MRLGNRLEEGPLFCELLCCYRAPVYPGMLFAAFAVVFTLVMGGLDLVRRMHPQFCILAQGEKFNKRSILNGN